MEGYTWRESVYRELHSLTEKTTALTAECNDLTRNSARIGAHQSKRRHGVSSNYIEQIWQKWTRVAMTVIRIRYCPICHNCVSSQHATWDL